MKKAKEQKAITLIALVITIIVLLILAGVALSALFGNSSIIDNANYAVQEYNKSANADEGILNQVQNLFAKYMGTAPDSDDDNNGGGDNNSDDDDTPTQQPKITQPTQEVQAQYGNLVNVYQDAINQDLFTFTTSEESGGIATITGINWDYFVDPENPYAFRIVNSGYNQESRKMEYVFSVTTYAKQREIENALRKLIIPYEVVVNDSTYTVTRIDTTITSPMDISFEGLDGGDGYTDYDYTEDGFYMAGLAAGSRYGEYGSDDTTYLIIPGSVTSIGELNLLPRNEILFSASSPITQLPDYVFYGNEYLTDVVFPSGLTSIGAGTFSECFSLESITIPSGVTTIGDYAFDLCTHLTSISMPNTLTTIGEYAFNRCDRLESITIPSGVTTMGDYMFSECESLKTVTILGNITSMGNYICYGSSSTPPLET